MFPDNPKPLPLLVAEIWDFPLAYHEIEGEIWYAVQDWIRGLIGMNSDKASDIWINMQRIKKNDVPFNIKSLPYRASNEKIYKVDFTHSEGLLTIMLKLRTLCDRMDATTSPKSLV